jgi:predicted RNA-binding Zn ribbon-like protein
VRESGSPVGRGSPASVPAPPPDLPFRWLGGRLCLDYANTVAWFSVSDNGQPARLRPEYERFTGYGRLVAWAQAAGVLPEPQAASLLGMAEADAGAAAGALRAALDLREAVHRLFVAVAEGRAPDVAALAVVTTVLRRALAHRTLVAAKNRFAWAWEGAGESLEAPLWPVALCAAELLASDDLRRVRQCAGEDCGFLFLDTGRGPGRRWCVMAHCGNRAKARRHYRRMRGGQ